MNKTHANMNVFISLYGQETTKQEAHIYLLGTKTLAKHKHLLATHNTCQAQEHMLGLPT